MRRFIKTRSSCRIRERVDQQQCTNIEDNKEAEDLSVVLSVVWMVVPLAS